MRRNGSIGLIVGLTAVLATILCIGAIKDKKEKARISVLPSEVQMEVDSLEDKNALSNQEKRAASIPLLPEDTLFDFRANGIVMQTEQYGMCRIQIESDESFANFFVAGKNLCGGMHGTHLPRENNGISYSMAEDGSIIVNGTAEENSICYIAGTLGAGTTNEDRVFLQEGKYTYSGCPEGGSNSTYRLRVMVVDRMGETTYYNDYGEGVTFTLREAAYIATCVQVFEGVTVDYLRFCPQIEIGTESTEYEMYRGAQYQVEIKNGTGVLDIELSKSEKDTALYTLMSTESRFTVDGFGTVEMCTQPIYHASQPHFAIVDDDGKEEVYSILMPLLNERGITFSTSVLPLYLNKTGFLSTDQLREIVGAGNKVMCHSKSHTNLVKEAVTYEEKYEEIIGGKQMLEELGFEVDTMVYPNGSYDDVVLEITKSAYRYGVATHGETAYGKQRYNRDPIDIYAIQRINIGSYYAGETEQEKAVAL